MHLPGEPRGAVGSAGVVTARGERDPPEDDGAVAAAQEGDVVDEEGIAGGEGGGAGVPATAGAGSGFTDCAAFCTSSLMMRPLTPLPWT